MRSTGLKCLVLLLVYNAGWGQKFNKYELLRIVNPGNFISAIPQNLQAANPSQRGRDLPHPPFMNLKDGFHIR